MNLFSLTQNEIIQKIKENSCSEILQYQFPFEYHGEKLTQRHITQFSPLISLEPRFFSTDQVWVLPGYGEFEIEEKSQVDSTKKIKKSIYFAHFQISVSPNDGIKSESNGISIDLFLRDINFYPLLSNKTLNSQWLSNFNSYDNREWDLKVWSRLKQQLDQYSFKPFLKTLLEKFEFKHPEYLTHPNEEKRDWARRSIKLVDRVHKGINLFLDKETEDIEEITTFISYIKYRYWQENKLEPIK